MSDSTWFRRLLVVAGLWATAVFAEAGLAADEQPVEIPVAEPEAIELGESRAGGEKTFDYRPGRGLKVEPLGLVVGGFLNVKAETTKDSGEEFTVDLLDFFLIFDRFERFRAVADLQMKDVLAWDDDSSGFDDFAFDVRRLFGDYKFADELRVRAGTFLTPVGYWNLILAPPLTWTTEMPLIVEEEFFQQTTTGVMVHGSAVLGRGQLSYSLYGHFLDPLEDDPELAPPELAAGARVTYDQGPGWSVGASFQSAEEEDVWSHLGGLHLFVQLDRGEILGEVYYEDSDEDGDQWGTYTQGVLELWDPLYLVGRYEFFDPREINTPVHVFTVGGVFRPFSYMAVKVEYRFADRRLDDEDLEGFFASFTTFF